MSEQTPVPHGILSIGGSLRFGEILAASLGVEVGGEVFGLVVEEAEGCGAFVPAAWVLEEGRLA